MSNNTKASILFPYEPEEFWERMRLIVREEVTKTSKEQASASLREVDGLTYKPLLKIAKACTFFRVSRPTIYEWIKDGKLKPFKIRRRVYFLWSDIQKLLPVS
jgi:excisionase family DNA binding protein